MNIYKILTYHAAHVSKIGFQSCPEKHFDCMMKQDAGKIVEEVIRNF